MKTFFAGFPVRLTLLSAVMVCNFTCLEAQTVTPDYQPLSGAQLDTLLGPIALYPDPVTAEILPAATQPTEIVLADRYLAGGGDPNLASQQPWDPSVQALTHYPTVLQWLDNNLTWTTAVGLAFLNQQQDVLDSLQRLRQTALNLGNLPSTPQEQIINDGSDIEIVPADPEVIYLPVYQTSQVYFISGGGTMFITFGPGYPLGGWLAGDFDWYHHRLVVWDQNHPRPANWWRLPARQRDAGQAGNWQRGGHQGNRGWVQNPTTPSAVTIVGHGSTPREEATPRQYSRPEAAQTERPSADYRMEPPQNSRPEDNRTFNGGSEARPNAGYGERSEPNREVPAHAEPAPRPEPTPRPEPPTHTESSGGSSHPASSGASDRQWR